MKKRLIIFFSIIALTAFTAWAPDAGAFSNFGATATGETPTNCKVCHTNTFEGGTDNTNHNIHSDAVGGVCGVCHAPGLTVPPTLDNCVQCHVPEGLREHHRNAGASTCSGCHSSTEDQANLVPEDTIPPGYPGGTSPVATIALDPCDGSEERFGSFTISLDNDGDLDYDGDDSDCACGNGVDDPGEDCDLSVEGTQCCNPDCTFNTGDPCEDDDLCTTGDTCDAGACIPGTSEPCQDDGDPCTFLECDPATGNCTITSPEPDDTPCDDGDACTGPDTCSGGTCVGGPPPDCDDGNLCTTDSCNPATGCANEPLDCDDGDLCTTDSCDPATGCANDPVVCPAGESCDPGTGTCVPDDLCDGNTCDDGDVCNGVETCDPADGSCIPGTPLDCDDGDLCTTDSCDPAAGCANDPVVCPAGESCDPGTGNCIPDDLCDGNTCDDGDACNGVETCDPADGSCIPGTPLDCDDGDLCTTDSCDPAAGCANDPVVCPAGESCDPGTGNCIPDDLCDGNTCDDGDACNGVETCDPADGSCIPGTPLDCDDGDLCTTDSCDPAAGCGNDPVVCPAGESCDPGTGNCVPDDLCAGVICPDDGNPCTDEVCNPATGQCETNNNSDPCEDGDACTENDTCSGGACSGDPIVCGDGEACEDGQCVPVAQVDVKLQRFHVPMNIKECRKVGKDIAVSVKNLGDVEVTGDVTLYKDGVPKIIWEDVVFDLIGGRRTNLIFTYLPDPEDTGKRIEWQAVVDVPGDPNPSNNTSRVKKMKVKPCK